MSAEAHAKRVVLLDDPCYDPEEAPMEFRLTYSGPLLAADRADNSNENRRQHKYELRRAFHLQLKRLWEVVPHLKTGKSGPDHYVTEESPDPPVYLAREIGEMFSRWGFRFVPMVRKSIPMMCGLDILFLREDLPGAVIHHGDIDNRLKTLFDALSLPDDQELYVKRTPLPDEDLLFCLLENDRLITKISVETDRLLQPVDNPGDVRLVITVRIRPYEPDSGNLRFV